MKPRSLYNRTRSIFEIVLKHQLPSRHMNPRCCNCLSHCGCDRSVSKYLSHLIQETSIQILKYWNQKMLDVVVCCHAFITLPGWQVLCTLVGPKLKVGKVKSAQDFYKDFTKSINSITRRAPALVVALSLAWPWQWPSEGSSSWMTHDDAWCKMSVPLALVCLRSGHGWGGSTCKTFPVKNRSDEHPQLLGSRP